MKRALITGISGQTGSYLAELLLDKGYEVHGVVRRTSTPSTSRIARLIDTGCVKIHAADMLDQSSLNRVIQEVQPHEIYNLAAQSHVGESFKQPLATANATGLGALRMLEAVRQAKPDARFYQASSSEMFGRVVETPQKETTPFRPRSPYGCAKVFAHYATINYRESYGLFACSGIAFNHESPRRGTEFVTRKITLAVARIRHGLQERLRLGNLKALRDWGHARDFVRGMWLMLQQPEPDDYVLATGETHTVEEFADLAFQRVGLNWSEFTEVDQQFVRPAEVDLLCGNPQRAAVKLGWAPEVQFVDLVNEMVDSDLAAVAGVQRGVE